MPRTATDGLNRAGGLLAAAVAWLPALALAAPDTATLENARLRVTFDARRGGAIVSFVDKKTGRDFISRDAAAGLYELTLRDSTRKRIRVTERDAGRAALAGSARRVTVSAAAHGEHRIGVECECRLPEGAEAIECRIRVTNRGPLELFSVRFPAVEFPARLGDSAEDDFLLLPMCDGQVITRPETNVPSGGRRTTYPGGASMQLLAYYDATAGIRAAALDGHGHRKEIGITRRGQVFGLGMVHYPVLGPAPDFVLPYAVEVGVFHGGWQAAASAYKKWAVKQPWCRAPLEKRRRELPEWLRRAPFFYTVAARGQDAGGKPAIRYDIIAEESEGYARLLGSPVCAMIMGWEKHGSWYTPHYFPPAGGEAAFKALTARLSAAGNRSLVFLSGLKWTLRVEIPRPLQDSPYDDTAAFVREAESSAIVGEDGKTEIAGDPTRATGRYAQLCPATQYAQDLAARISRQCTELGIDAVQLDQLVGGGMPACYSTRHGHPPGGGNWCSQAVYRLFERLRREGKQRSPDFAFLIEEPGELYIPVLDAYHARDYAEGRWPRDGRGVRGVPLFTYVYHDYLIGYGGDSADISPTPSPQNLYSAAANLVNGKIPAAAVWGRKLPPETVHRDQIKLLAGSMALMRGPAREYLLYGERLPEPELDVPPVTVPVWVQSTNKSEPRTMPSVQHSAWRLSGGRLGWVLVNLGGAAIEMDYPLAGATGALHVRRIGGTGEAPEPAREVILPGRYHLKLAPYEPVFLEASPRR